MENKNFTVEIHAEGLNEPTAKMLFGSFLEIAEQWGITVTGGVYETPTAAEQIEIIKKQAEIIETEETE